MFSYVRLPYLPDKTTKFAISTFKFELDVLVFGQPRTETMFSYFLFISALVVAAQAADFNSNNANRVINGQIAQPNQFPWHAIIEGTQLNSQRTLCGGALISNSFVLTAAHCIFGTT